MSLLITVEGLDGTGKSTLVNELVKTVTNNPAFHPWVYATKEPGSPWAATQEIRELVLNRPDLKPIERELLFYADAAIHRRFIENQENAVIFSDRGMWSHLAYLRGYLKTGQIDHSVYDLCRKLIEQVCAKPDCVVYLRGDLDLMKKRLAGKPKDAIENNSETFFAYVLETYEDLVTHHLWKGERVVILDACHELDKLSKCAIEYIKGAFDAEQLKSGNTKLC